MRQTLLMSVQVTSSMKQLFKNPVIWFLAFVLLFTPLISAHALTVSPARLEIDGNPGSQLKIDMVLMNDKDENQVFYSSYANFEAQGESGTPNFVDPKEGLGTWMKVPESVTLSPFETKTVPVVISIPNTADAGGHFASVFWSTVPSQGSQPGQVAIGAKLGVLVLLRVNGDITENGSIVDFTTKDGIKKFSALPVTFTYRFNNAGDDRVKPVGTLTIKNILGMKRTVIDGNPSQGNVLPKSTRKFELAWNKKNAVNEVYVAPVGFWDNVSYQWKHFAFGRYTANLSLVYTSKNIADSATTTFYVFPWQLLIVIIIAAIIAYLLLKRIMRSYNRMLIAQVREKIEEEVEERLEAKQEQEEEEKVIRKPKSHHRPRV